MQGDGHQQKTMHEQRQFVPNGIQKKATYPSARQANPVHRPRRVVGVAVRRRGRVRVHLKTPRRAMPTLQTTSRSAYLHRRRRSALPQHHVMRRGPTAEEDRDKDRDDEPRGRVSGARDVCGGWHASATAALVLTSCPFLRLLLHNAHLCGSMKVFHGDELPAFNEVLETRSTDDAPRDRARASAPSSIPQARKQGPLAAGRTNRLENPAARSCRGGPS